MKLIPCLDFYPLTIPPPPHPTSSTQKNNAMPKNKSAKRKRNTVPTPPQKLPKTTTATITPPRDVSPLEPKTLQTVISDDELDITIETLTTLSQFPSLLKSKACKDLRAAVFDFRKACTTGANAAGSIPVFPG